jgi:hypothetical protein
MSSPASLGAANLYGQLFAGYREAPLSAIQAARESM